MQEEDEPGKLVYIREDPATGWHILEQDGKRGYYKRLDKRHYPDWKLRDGDDLLSFQGGWAYMAPAPEDKPPE